MNRRFFYPGIQRAILTIAFTALIFSCGWSQVYYYAPEPRFTYLGSAFSSIGVTYYPSAATNNFDQNNNLVSGNTSVIAVDYRTLFYHPVNYSPITAGISFDGFESSTPSNNTDLQYYGGSFNLCLYHLPKKFYQSPVSLYEGIELGLGYANGFNNVPTYEQGSVNYENWFVNFKASVGMVIFLNKVNREALSLDLGYNFDNYNFSGYNLKPEYFMRVAFCFGRGARYIQ